jgi:hypothetical protein
MALTEYEIADLALNAQASATPTTALLITIISGYLIVAWLAGAKLTRPQVILINLLFTFFQTSLVAGWIFRWELAYKYFTELNLLVPDFYTARSPVLLILFSVVLIASVPACLKFMWDVRHPKTE